MNADALIFHNDEMKNIQVFCFFFVFLKAFKWFFFNFSAEKIINEIKVGFNF